LSDLAESSEMRAESSVTTRCDEHYFDRQRIATMLGQEQDEHKSRRAPGMVMTTAKQIQAAKAVARAEENERRRQLERVNIAACRLQCAVRAKRARHVLSRLQYEARTHDVILRDRADAWLAQQRMIHRPGYGIVDTVSPTN